LASLGLGEGEAITLASSFQPPAPILRDDRRARGIAREFGLVVIGSGGLLGLTKEAGFIPAVQPILSELRAAGLFISDPAVREILDVAGEE